MEVGQEKWLDLWKFEKEGEYVQNALYETPRESIHFFSVCRAFSNATSKYSHIQWSSMLLLKNNYICQSFPIGEVVAYRLDQNPTT